MRVVVLDTPAPQGGKETPSGVFGSAAGSSRMEWSVVIVCVRVATGALDISVADLAELRPHVFVASGFALGLPQTP